MHITFVILISYFIGSIPTAFIAAKFFGGYDLRKEGSRNIGARNAYEVTNNRSVGITVLVLDVLKGLLPVLILLFIDFSGAIPFASAALILGHCYPLWLKFQGGRGLATTAGVLLLVCPVLIPIWLAAYFVSGFVKKNVHLQTVIAVTVAAAAELIFFPDIVNIASIASASWSAEVLLRWQYSITMVFLIILSRHIEPLRTLNKL
jgi:glycerol-3-phosphate acyltransferase PlsY